MREAFSQALVKAALADERVVLLTGDHGYALFDDFRRACPTQYINAGVAEQNMVGVAAGLAKGGFRPIVYGLSAFVPVRVLEQIKLDICYEELPVVFIGDGAGVVYSALGSSHQSTEDIAALRALPQMAILSPADAHEMTACMELALQRRGPVYLRMGKADLGAVHLEVPSLAWGKLLRVQAGDVRHVAEKEALAMAGAEPKRCPESTSPGHRLGSATSHRFLAAHRFAFGRLKPIRLAWIATGSMVTTAMEVAALWPGSKVYSAACIKPLDSGQVSGICRRHQAVIVLEEHSVYGGLGSAVAEISAAEAPTWVCRVGIQDRFSKCCGSYSYLMKEHRLDVESITAQVSDFLQSKRLEQRRAA